VKTNSQVVAILGASQKPDRYAYLALKKLQANGHRVVLVNPTLDVIDGQPVLKSLADISEAIDTLTVYVNPEKLRALLPDILHLRPGRVIFNPDTEEPTVMKELDKHRIPHVEACTLVLLSTHRF
jgi:predicted CoA-binding protein